MKLISVAVQCYHLDILLYAGMVACSMDGKVKKFRAAQKAIA